jgi:type I restriction enzyme R subunit
VNQAEIDALNEQVDEVVEDEEDIASREKTKSEWAALEKLVGSEPRLQQVAATWSSTSRRALGGWQGHDRVHEPRHLRAALQRHRHPAARLARRRPEKGAIKIVMTGSAADKALAAAAPLQQAGQESAWKSASRTRRPAEAGDRARHVADRLRCAVLHTMYVDKPMKGHNLMQAIARVNRCSRTSRAAWWWITSASPTS